MPIPLDVVYATCFDERYPPVSMVDGKPNTFFMTTGLYPQEIIFSFKAGAANIRKVIIVTNGAKQYNIEKCHEPTATNFTELIKLTMPSPANQRQEFDINNPAVGAKVRFLRLIINEGYSEFTGVVSFEVEGEEVEDDVPMKTGGADDIAGATDGAGTNGLGDEI